MTSLSPRLKKPRAAARLANTVAERAGFWVATLPPLMRMAMLIVVMFGSAADAAPVCRF
jgi:hypothetical protein